jgi:hypothetical protein
VYGPPLAAIAERTRSAIGLKLLLYFVMRSALTCSRPCSDRLGPAEGLGLPAEPAAVSGRHRAAVELGAQGVAITTFFLLIEAALLPMMCVRTIDPGSVCRT